MICPKCGYDSSRVKIPMVKVNCTECGIEFYLPADDESLIAWEGCFCSEDCRLSHWGEQEDIDEWEDEFGCE